MNNYTHCFSFFDSVGIGYYDVPNNIIDFLKEESNKGESTNHTLIGHIKEEYKIQNVPNYLTDFILSKCDVNPMKHHLSKVRVLSKNVPRKLDKIWINFQKKYEFNPIHDHSGFASFIIFLKIPYNLDDEDKVFPTLSSISHTSKLAFTLPKPSGNLSHTALPVDRSFENKMLLFPANYFHNVYPFYTSDDYRITVAGNLVLDVD